MEERKNISMYFKTEPQDTICRSQMGCIALHLVKLSAPSICSANIYVCNRIHDKEESFHLPIFLLLPSVPALVLSFLLHGYVAMDFCVQSFAFLKSFFFCIRTTLMEWVHPLLALLPTCHQRSHAAHARVQMYNSARAPAGCSRPAAAKRASVPAAAARRAG